MNLIQLENNINIVRERIAAAASKSNYNVSDITLVGASKTMPIEVIDMVDKHRLLGVLGENRAQELRDKYRVGQSFDWHYIGALQSSNIRIVLPRASLVHSVDRHSIALEVNQYCINHNVMASCLLQVNMGEEESKSGFMPCDIDNAIAAVKAECSNVNVKGIMAVMPIAPDDVSIELYRRLGEIFQRNKQLYNGFDILSAGMTGDYSLAIEHAGSNMVRVGRAIFGDRQ